MLFMIEKVEEKPLFFDEKRPVTPPKIWIYNFYDVTLRQQRGEQQLTIIN